MSVSTESQAGLLSVSGRSDQIRALNAGCWEFRWRRPPCSAPHAVAEKQHAIGASDAVLHSAGDVVRLTHEDDANYPERDRN